METKKILQVTALPGFEPEIGRLVWCMEDVRHILLKKLSGISQAALNYKGDHTHSIGTLLYHIAYVEAGWLYGEVIEKNGTLKFPHCSQSRAGQRER